MCKMCVVSESKCINLPMNWLKSGILPFRKKNRHFLIFPLYQVFYTQSILHKNCNFHGLGELDTLKVPEVYFYHTHNNRLYLTTAFLCINLTFCDPNKQQTHSRNFLKQYYHEYDQNQAPVF